MNRFRNYVLMAAGFVVALLAVGSFTAGPAIAQALRAALVSNADDPGRIPYAGNVDCHFPAGSSVCDGSLAPVPAGKRLVITHVAGLLQENLPGGTLILLEVSGGVATSRPLATYQGSFGAVNYFVFYQPVLLFYDAVQTPIVFVTLGAAPDAHISVAEFHLTGYMLDCTIGPCNAIAK